MKEENEIAERLKNFLKEELAKITVPRTRRIFVYVNKDALRKALEFMVKDLRFKHLSTITGVDSGEEIEVIYHLAYKGSIMLSARISVSKKNPDVPTITDLIPGAVLYEREVHDLLGVSFKRHPDLSPLMLPEKWPEGVYPLRKESQLLGLREVTLRSKRDE